MTDGNKQKESQHNTTQHSTTQHITSLPIDIISYHITQREPAHKSTDTSQCLPCTHAQVPNTTENVRSPGCSLYACNQINDLPTPSLSPNRSRLLTHSHKPSHTITIISDTRFSRNTAPFRSVPFRSISFHPIPFQYAPLHYTTPRQTTPHSLTHQPRTRLRLRPAQSVPIAHAATHSNSHYRLSTSKTLPH